MPDTTYFRGMTPTERSRKRRLRETEERKRFKAALEAILFAPSGLHMMIIAQQALSPTRQEGE